MSRYACCQGYMDGAIPCFRSGQCGESSCPDLCLCMEVICSVMGQLCSCDRWDLTSCSCVCRKALLCNGCAVTSTRMLVMDRHNLRPDPWDNRIVVRTHPFPPQNACLLLLTLHDLLLLKRWNNCIQMASVVCDLFSICVPELKDLAKILDCVAHCSYASTQGCMTVRSICYGLDLDIIRLWRSGP